MIDGDGFRANVGIMVANPRGQLLWARRVGGMNAWQFPQGGMQSGETPEQALYRELHEEVGLKPEHVNIIDVTQGWLRYRLPRKLVRENKVPLCIGQKQKWFLLELIADESLICFDQSAPAEFDAWRWVSYWYPVEQVVSFKREVYRRALKALSPAHSLLEQRLERE